MAFTFSRAERLFRKFDRGRHRSPVDTNIPQPAQYRNELTCIAKLMTQLTSTFKRVDDFLSCAPLIGHEQRT